MTPKLTQVEAQFASKVFNHIRELSKTEEPGRGVTRLGYTEKEIECVKALEAFGVELGLVPEYDDSGCLWLTLEGLEPQLPAIVSGSHADSVPQGGNFDGLAGIVAALTVAKGIKEAGIKLKRTFKVLVIRSEEQALIGSTAMMGRLTEKDLLRRWNANGPTLKEMMVRIGLDPKKCMTGKPVIDLSRIAAFLELHIEQGPRLAARTLKEGRTGLVTGIRGSVYHHVIKCVGQTAHSGAIDYEYRRDAVAATTRLMSRMFEHWKEFLARGEDLVYTNGVIKTPEWSSFNKICGEVVFSVDMRTLSVDTRERFYQIFKSECQSLEEEMGVKFIFDEPGFLVPMPVDKGIFNRFKASAARQNVNIVEMPSGAGHDAQNFGLSGVPFAMIFVANDKGSHNPDEAMEIDDFMLGTSILFDSVINWDN